MLPTYPLRPAGFRTSGRLNQVKSNPLLRILARDDVVFSEYVDLAFRSRGFVSGERMMISIQDVLPESPWEDIFTYHNRIEREYERQRQQPIIRPLGIFGLISDSYIGHVNLDAHFDMVGLRAIQKETLEARISGALRAGRAFLRLGK